jgi:hypothetical protein
LSKLDVFYLPNVGGFVVQGFSLARFGGCWLLCWGCGVVDVG